MAQYPARLIPFLQATCRPVPPRQRRSRALNAQARPAQQRNADRGNNDAVGPRALPPPIFLTFSAIPSNSDERLGDERLFIPFISVSIKKCRICDLCCTVVCGRGKWGVGGLLSDRAETRLAIKAGTQKFCTRKTNYNLQVGAGIFCVVNPIWRQISIQNSQNCFLNF